MFSTASVNLGLITFEYIDNKFFLFAYKTERLRSRLVHGLHPRTLRPRVASPVVTSDVDNLWFRRRRFDVLLLRRWLLREQASAVVIFVFIRFLDRRGDGFGIVCDFYSHRFGLGQGVGHGVGVDNDRRFGLGLRLWHRFGYGLGDGLRNGGSYLGDLDLILRGLLVDHILSAQRHFLGSKSREEPTEIER